MDEHVDVASSEGGRNTLIVEVELVRAVRPLYFSPGLAVRKLNSAYVRDVLLGSRPNVSGHTCIVSPHSIKGDALFAPHILLLLDDYGTRHPGHREAVYRLVSWVSTVERRNRFCDRCSVSQPHDFMAIECAHP